jgi:hypothetical protein
VLNEDELGVALHDALVTLVSTIEPSHTLMKRVLGEPQPVRATWLAHSLRRRLIAIPVALVAGLVAAILFLTGSGVTPSFAVTRYSDGSVVITLHDLTGVTGANARLRQLGVRAVVVPITSTCTTKADLTYIGVAEHPGPSTRLIPSEIPAGTTVLLAASQIGANKIEMAIGRVRGTPPSCVAPGTTGPGISPSFSHKPLKP